LPPGAQAILEAQLFEVLNDSGYERDDATAPAPSAYFADLVVGDRPPPCSQEGEMKPGLGGTAEVRVNGEDFWVELPEEEFDATAVREVWVCLRGDTGTHSSLFWRGPGERFGEPRCLHVPFHPGPHWQVVRFQVAGHPHWNGTVRQLRFDPFNGTISPGAGGELRWLRRVE